MLINEMRWEITFKDISTITFRNKKLYIGRRDSLVSNALCVGFLPLSTGAGGNRDLQKAKDIHSQVIT